MQIENPQNQTVSRVQGEGCTQQNIHLHKINQCRICLQAHVANEPSSKLISPCKCTGTLRYVHEICLEQWISKLVIKSGGKVKAGKAHIFCELCNSKIYFRTQTKLKLKTKQQIKTHFCENIKTFVLLMLLLITNLGFFAALLNYLLFVGFKILIQNNVVLVSLMISGQVIFSIVAVVTLVCILNKYLLQRETKIYEIMDRSQAQTLITQKGHGCLKKKRQSKYLQPISKNQQIKPQ